MMTGDPHAVLLTLPEGIANCVDAIGKYRALREELFRLRLSTRSLPGGPWRPRYKRNAKKGDPTLPPKITHHTGTLTIEGLDLEAIAYISQPETYAPFTDLELIDPNDQPAPEGSEASKAVRHLGFVLSSLLEAVKLIVGSIVLIERQAKSLHLKTDTTPLTDLSSVHLPVFPYWPKGTGLQKEDFDKVLADERPILDAALLTLHRLALETNATATGAKHKVTAERLRSRLDDLADDFRHLQERLHETPLVSSRTPDGGIVTVDQDAAFRRVADTAGSLFMIFPDHWRFGVQESTVALLDPGERWIGAILDLAFAGVIELATWNGVDHVEVLQDSVAASLLAIQGIIKNSKRPNKGKGTYIAQKEMVKFDADEEFAKLSVEKRPDLATLHRCVSKATFNASQIVRMSRLPSTPSPEGFIGSFVRLEEYLERLSSIKDLPALLSQWPEEPKGFTWGRHTQPSALERGIGFAESIHKAAAFGRHPHGKKYWDEQPVAHVPGEGIIRWTELAMQELREVTIPLSYVWPTLGDIDEDRGLILYAIEGEYRRAGADSDFKIEEPTDEALRIIYEMGRHMERLPTFRGQGEEALRGSFVSALGLSSFIVTAESLNGKGKTDILVSRNGVNVLIGECKFWDGPKKYFETIDQLAGYVIHQDPKAAILLFVRGQDISHVATQVEQVTQGHQLWSKTIGKRKDNWYDFDFRKAPKSNHTTRVSIMCFHFPSDA